MLNSKRVFMAIALVLLLAGCESMSPIKAFKDKDKQDTLTKTLHSYELTVRWGELTQIYTFLEPDMARGTIKQDNLNNIRVTGYEVIKGPASTGENDAIQTAKIDYIFSDRQVQKTIIDTQTWVYKPDQKEWRRTNPIPKF